VRPIARLTILALTLALAACGGGGDDRAEQEKENRSGAEATVRAYLTALVTKNGGEACSKFTPEYQRSVLRQNRAFARGKGVDDCAGLIDALTRAAPSVSFEGVKLTRDSVGDLRFETSVRQSGEEYNATVTGRQGIQRYELETSEGDWKINKIERIR
jgi:hypothetical protein